jgi:hypothetical protein
MQSTCQTCQTVAVIRKCRGSVTTVTFFEVDQCPGFSCVCVCVFGGGRFSFKGEPGSGWFACYGSVGANEAARAGREAAGERKGGPRHQLFAPDGGQCVAFAIKGLGCRMWGVGFGVGLCGGSWLWCGSVVVLVRVHHAKYGASKYGASEYGASEYGASKYGASKYGARARRGACTPCTHLLLSPTLFTGGDE